MILITRLDKSQFYVNAELIQYLDPTPDTVIITLVNDVKLVVREPVDVLVERIIDYHRQVHSATTLVKTGA